MHKKNLKNQTLRPIRYTTIAMIDRLAAKTGLPKVEIYQRAVSRFFKSEMKRVVKPKQVA